MALVDLHGNSDIQYSLVWDYAQEIRRTNPGSTVLIGVDSQPSGPVIFDRMYICLHALKVGFLLGCRSLIGVDGCHLKGPHGGVLLAATGVDPNNNLWPIAYAAVGKENGDTWNWFLTVLKKDLEIEKDEEWTFISDKQKGLVQAMQSVFPGAAHRFCVRHLLGNMKNAGYGSQNFKNALHRASKATTKNDFNRRMNDIRELNPMLAEWLSDKPPEQWSKSHFNEHAVCDMVMNNISESFNASILPARELPIISMLEWIMDWCRSRLQKNRDRAIQNIIQENVKRVGSCDPKKADHYQMRMVDGRQYAVDLHKKTCGCRRWDLTGIPCLFLA